MFVSSIDRSFEKWKYWICLEMSCFLCLWTGERKHCIQSEERVVILVLHSFSLSVLFYDQKKNERTKDVWWMSEEVLDRLLMSFRTSNTHLWPKHRSCKAQRSTDLKTIFIARPNANIIVVHQWTLNSPLLMQKLESLDIAEIFRITHSSSIECVMSDVQRGTWFTKQRNYHRCVIL